MKKYIILFSLLLSISCNAWADSKGMKITSAGAAFTLGIDAENTLDFDSTIGEVRADTGVDEHEAGVTSCKVTIFAGDDSKMDINECHVHIQGPMYSFDTITALDPNFGTGENSVYIGITMNGYTTSTPNWSNTQKLTVIPIARLNAGEGVTGPGSTINAIRDDRYFLTKRDYYDRIWHEEAIGSLYVSGGDIFANSTSGLVLGQNSGILYDAQSKRQSLSTFNNISAVFLHLSSNGTNWIASVQPLIVDNINYNPAGSGRVSLSTTNKYKIDTILKSPKGADGTPEGRIFLIYGETEYNTQADAVAAITNETATRFGPFINPAISGLVPIALIVQQRDLTTIDIIKDRRPCLVCRP